MENTKLNDIAQKVLNKIEPKDPEKYGFVITILMIISIILTVIRVIQECNKNKLSSLSGSSREIYFADQIKQTAIRKTWFTKMMLKKAIRKELGSDTYKVYGTDLMNAILSTGDELTDDEFITLAEAVNV